MTPTPQGPSRSRHRAESPPPTTPDPSPPEDATSSARRALDRLAGRAAPEPGRPPVQPDPLQRLRWAFRVGVVLAVVVVLAMGAIGLYTLSVGSDVADFKASGEVAANGQRRVDEVRGTPGQVCDPLVYDAASITLECANRAVVQVGGEPVPDPGEGVNSIQMGVAVARALDRLDRALERRPGGVPGSGVVAPGQGRFPGR